MEILKVSAKSINAVPIPSGFLAPSGEDIVLVPAFNEVIINGENKTALKLLIEKK